MSNIDMTKWYRLDNAAKIYPVLSTERYTHVFRVSITLKEKIIPSVLSKAIQDMRDRFPTFYVKLKHGLFWFYFEPNDKNPIVKEESSIICQKINIHRNNGFYFTFLYYENRISLEVFHALSDGAGAIIFLKSVVFQYLRLLDRPVESEGEIFTLGELPTYKEIEDSYEINCTKAKKIPNRIPDAYLVTGKRFEYVGCGVINSEIDTQKLLALSKEKNCSLTQYIVALLIHSLIVTGDSKKLRQKPINVCVPINLRPLYHSETLRNFSLYFHVSYYSKTDDPDIDDIITIVKKAFENEMTPEKIQSKLNSNVLISKKIYVRFLPLFIKKVLFKIAYTYYAKKPTTITIANFGNVSLPSSMVQYVDSFTFNLGSGSKPAVAMNSFNGKTKIIFSRALVSTEIEKAFFTYLTSNKLEVKIESNHFETNCKPEIK